MSQPEIFVLRLRAAPGNWRAPVTKRLALALKILLRSFGLRCTECRPERSEPTVEARDQFQTSQHHEP